MSTIQLFKIIENKHDVDRGTDFIKRFCEFLEEYSMKTVN